MSLRLVSMDGDIDRVIGAQPLVVGRGDHVDLFLTDSSVSRNHARLSDQGGWLSVHDLGSSNGTWVNGRQLSGSAQLHPGDNVTFGSVTLYVRDVASAPDHTAPHSRANVRIDHQRSDRDLYNVSGTLDQRVTNIGWFEDPWDELFNGTGTGRAMMALGLISVVIGFGLWMAFIFSGFYGAGTEFGSNPFTSAPKVLGLPQPILGFVLFGGGGLLMALGAGLSKASRHRRGEIVGRARPDRGR
ncbi:MAG TPA: FHA domain-containing protein [Acidimicrobiales bacterium]|nr:FHA domain-containing protein [Acidimicrobiales bacterium]